MTNEPHFMKQNVGEQQISKNIMQIGNMVSETKMVWIDVHINFLDETSGTVALPLPLPYMEFVNATYLTMLTNKIIIII